MSILLSEFGVKIILSYASLAADKTSGEFGMHRASHVTESSVHATIMIWLK
jgi:hypothetical protein